MPTGVVPAIRGQRNVNQPATHPEVVDGGATCDRDRDRARHQRSPSPVEAAQDAFNRGAFERALATAAAVVAGRPNALAARHVAALSLKRMGRLVPSRNEAIRTIALSPAAEACRLNFADILRREGRLGPARRLLRGSVAAAPADGDLRIMLTAVLIDQGDAFAAGREGIRSVAVAPERARAWYNLATALGARSRYAAAAVLLRRAARLDPAHLWSHHNLAIALRWLGRLREALAAFRRGLSLAPGDPIMHYHHAQCLLASGHLADGWTAMAWRWRTHLNRSPRRALPRPEWTGEPGSLTVLVWREQGIGDEIIFGSCLPDLARRVGRVVIECDARLVPLFTRSLPGAEVRASSVDPQGHEQRLPPDYDRHVPIADLPRYLRRSRSDFPTARGYLVADQEELDRWHAWTASLGPGRKIGLCWRSHWQNPDRDRYYCAAEELGPVLALRDCHFVNLQYDIRPEERDALERDGATIHQPPDIDQKQEIDRVAALLCSLDAIVGPAVSVAMLGGGLGRDVRMFYPTRHHFDFLGAPNYPWLPSIRPYFKPTLDTSWDPVLRRIADDLAAGSDDGRLGPEAAQTTATRNRRRYPSSVPPSGSGG